MSIAFQVETQRKHTDIFPICLIFQNTWVRSNALQGERNPFSLLPLSPFSLIPNKIPETI